MRIVGSAPRPIERDYSVNIEEVERHFTDLRAGHADRFDAMLRAVLSHQKERCAVYGRWSPASPFLPVAAFKHTAVTCFPPEEAEIVFESSGTGSGLPSRHYVRSLAVYKRAVRANFEAVFGRGPFTFVAHLPHYAERGRRSSLVCMARILIQAYGDGRSGFFLHDSGPLEEAVRHSRKTRTPLLLLGAAFGLLGLVEDRLWQLPENARVIETGGMKTFRREMTRKELHRRLADGFHVAQSRVWSEYGMCELMSQAWARGGSIYVPPPWMRVRVVDPEDPVRELPEGEPGVLAVFDLANLHSASAILTEDAAVQRGEGFEVVGRLSQSDLRGCNFLFDGT